MSEGKDKLKSHKKSESSGKSKSGGSYLYRQAKAKREVLTEEDLMRKQIITPEDVVCLTSATKGIWSRCVYRKTS